MKILVLSYEAWNDITNGNNVTSNWFEGMDAEFANIYASPGEPYNQCCQKYYQITDSMMLKSIISGKKAGKEVVWLQNTSQDKNSLAEEEPQKLYRFLKSISGDWLRFLREVLWLWGKYDIEGMKKFIDEFQPDIIFSERMASCKMLRLEKIVSGISSPPLWHLQETMNIHYDNSNFLRYIGLIDSWYGVDCEIWSKNIRYIIRCLMNNWRIIRNVSAAI